VKVREEHIARVVKEVEKGAEDPNHVATLVGDFMRRQAAIGQYVSASLSELAAEGIVLVLLHASIVTRSIEAAAGRRLRAIHMRDLDAAAKQNPSESQLAEEEPELAGYLKGNIPASDPTLGGKRHKAAMNLLHVVTRALLDV
jgi:hypothetical protein